jgi:hypothetical protein
MYRIIAVINSRIKLTKEHNEMNARPCQLLLFIYSIFLSDGWIYHFLVTTGQGAFKITCCAVEPIRSLPTFDLILTPTIISF